MRLINAAGMRELERRADAAGNSYAAMMERAGTLSARAIAARWPVGGRRVLVLTGPGNNGGDGLVCARVLAAEGASVIVYIWQRTADPADVNWRLCREQNIPLVLASEDADFSMLRAEVARAAVIVDALLGTGVTRPITGTLASLLGVVRAEVARRSSTPDPDVPFVTPTAPAAHVSRPVVAAIDLPSGLNPDTGALDPATLPADLTITFALPKLGQYAWPGAGAVGELVIADIGIPTAQGNADAPDLATAREVRALLPERPRDANKGTFGKVVSACGSFQFTGAPVLAARAAGRTGVGLVTLALPETIHAVVAARIDEATFWPLPDRLGDWRPRAATDLLARLWDTPYDALLVGCGLGTADSTGDFLVRLLENLPKLERPPGLVLDADGLNLLARIPEWWTALELALPPILTPHPGEMARLLDLTVAEVQARRRELAQEAARQWNAVVVLKGAFTVIAAPDGRVTLLPFATPALATAGTGDVLAGTIAGFLAQMLAASTRAEGEPDASSAGLEQAYRAAVVGGYIHGLAGELAGVSTGPAGVVAGDLLPRIPEALRRVQNDVP